MRKFTLLMVLTACINLLQAQTSPDYIFGAAGADWTTGVQGTQVASGVYQWQFTAAATGDQFFKLGETAAITDGSGFWTNGDGSDMTYTGAGAMWDVYYKANMGDGGAVKFAATTGNYYIIQARKNSGDGNAKFAVFESPSAIATIASVTQNFASPNLTVTVNASVAPAAVQKFWVRYTKDNWASSGITEAAVTGTAGTAVIDVTGMDKLEYYVFTTVQAPAGFTDYDFYTVSLNNNGGKNYTYYAPMAGNYYMPTVPDGQKGFASLSVAVTAINSAGLAGDVNFLINGDITEANDIALGVNTNSYTLTIKPVIGTQPTITFSKATVVSGTQMIDGHFIIGSPSAENTNLIPTHKVIIDGSNTPGGTTRDLKIVGATTTTTVTKSIIRIFGNNDNIAIKNCEIINNCKSGNAAAPINVTNYVGNFAADNLTIDNNMLNSSLANGSVGIQVSASGTPTVGIKGLIISNNQISSRQRGIFCNYVNDANIFGNTISEDSQSAQAGSAICMMTGTTEAGTFNLYENKIIRLTTSTTGTALTPSNGVIGIDNQLASPKIVNIHNNFFAGIDANSTSATYAKIYAIRHTSSSISNVYHNTILFPEMKDHSNSSIAAIAFATAATTEASPTGTINIKNNIIISNESGSTMKVWGIRRVGTGGTFTSDYNDIWANSANNIVGYFNNADASSLANWQTASTQDANSKSKNVYFASATDLSIAGTSINDPDLSAPALAAVTTDIFGAARHTPLVYKGAYEASDLNLPAPTKTFTVIAPVGTEKVYVAGSFTGKNWDITTPLELTATANPNEFSGTFACADGVEYKYFCEKGNWDYQEATSVNPLTWANNHTWAASDNVLYWYAMPKVTLNVSIGSGGIPANLFVKGSWNGWATAIELTKSGDTYSGFIGGNAGDKIYSNTQYKYYSNDPSADNWEVFTDNRWSIYPTMTDVIASFNTPIPATGMSEATEMSVRIMRTYEGITAVFDGNADVELYNINGALIEKTNVTGSYSRELKHGIYIIRINGVATKFIK